METIVPTPTVTTEQVRASERRRDRGIELDRKTKAELVAICHRLRPSTTYVIGGRPETWTKHNLVEHILMCEDDDRGDHCSAPTCRNRWCLTCVSCDGKLCAQHDRTHECLPAGGAM